MRERCWLFGFHHDDTTNLVRLLARARVHLATQDTCD